MHLPKNQKEAFLHYLSNMDISMVNTILDDNLTYMKVSKETFTNKLDEKIVTFKEYTELYNIKPEQVLYMGDDIPDFHVMQLVGLPTCPQDASTEIKAISKYISHKNGGKGAVREVIEQVMKVQGKWHMYYNGKHD